MAAKIQFHGHIDHDGQAAKMTLYNSKEIAQRTWEIVDGKVGQRVKIVVTFQADEPGIEHWRRKYYRGYVVPPVFQAANKQGQGWHDPDDANEFLKRLYLKPNKQGKYTTVGMSDKAFEQYVEKCIQWAADFFGIDFTTPKQAGMFPEAE